LLFNFIKKLLWRQNGNRLKGKEQDYGQKAQKGKAMIMNLSRIAEMDKKRNEI
jgi:hypothetical protein